jgi:AmiR/NasT family two-component response regulator
MKGIGLDEQDAFRRLQKLASGQNRKLVEVARMVVAGEQSYSDPGVRQSR